MEYKNITIKMSVADFDKLSTLAQSKGISKSELIRRKLKLKDFDKPRNPKIELSTEQVSLIRAANNINQLAKIANRFERLDLFLTRDDVTEFKRLVAELKRRL